MTFVPTPPEEMPTPDAILARLDPAPGEGPTGYIKPDDLRFAWQAFLSALVALGEHVPPEAPPADWSVLATRPDGVAVWDVGVHDNIASYGHRLTDIEDTLNILLTRQNQLVLGLGDVSHVGVNGGIEAVLQSLTNRIHALEEATPTVPGPTIPTSEGPLEVDNYSNGFVRVRDTGNLLADGQIHPVHLAVATVPGPGGAIFPTANDIPTGTGPVWFDVGGTLGYVDSAAGAHVTQTGLRNWTKYGDPATPNHYVLYCRQTVAADDGSKPLLVVESAVSVA
jgi:hypothetical protein